MPSQLTISLGQYSDKGRKAINQDFHGACVPRDLQLTTKGIAVALADGISSSDVSQIASEATISGFFSDYYCTPETWSVKHSAERVLTATNSWLHSQTQQSPYRYYKDKGYVCTLSSLILKSTTAHLFHVGDARIYRLHGSALEQLTRDHRVWVSQEESHLSRAMGASDQLELDYRALPLECDDIFVLLTDGVYEFVDATFMADTLRDHSEDLDTAARLLVNEAYKRGSTDNLTAQIVRIDTLPRPDSDELVQQLTDLPFPPPLDARMEFDGYRIVRQLHASSRSHVYLAVDEETGAQVTLKALATDLQQDPVQIERFLMEEWIARRIDSPHVVKPCLQDRKRHYLYTVTEFIEGQTLKQWLVDNPKPDLETVRGLVEQIARGLRAFHRLEMLHQDLRPDNIMIDATGTVKLIDFGSTRVAGLLEIRACTDDADIRGTAQYTAPEYFIGESGSPRSDLFSLGVIAYQMLTGRLPYGTRVAKARTRAAQHKLSYQPVLAHNREVPAWIDEVLKRAVHPDPQKRYEDLSELLFDLRHPGKHRLNKTRPPLIEREPVLFWKCLSLILSLVIAALLITHY